MMKLPNKIKIAGVDVDVIDWNHHAADAAGAYGQYSRRENCIKVDTTTNSLRVMETFLHELLHGIWDGYHLSDEDKEERTVAVFASGLTQVLRDNPSLMEYLEDAVKEK